MKHYYAFGDSTFGEHEGLEPKSFSDSLFRGITGHEALQEFYLALANGKSYEAACQTVTDTLNMIAFRPQVMSNPNHLNIVTDLKTRILPRYLNGAGKQKYDEGWRPAHVEEIFRLEMDFGNGRYVYPFRPDVIMRDPAGNLWVWDHKFVYNFYTPDQINLLPQIPKYVGALRATGLYVKGGFYNQLRWREVKDFDKHVLQTPFTPTDARVKNAFRQQIRVMEQIAERKRMASTEWQADSTRVLSTMVCKSCSFKYLCTTELNGESSELMRKVEFQSNSYGYSAEAVTE
jgi:hypothetical protein